MSVQPPPNTEPTKDLDNQQPIPTCWRGVLGAIAEAPACQNYTVASIPCARLSAPSVATSIANNVADYGETLTALNDDTWASSTAQWMDGYWDAIVDLRTIESGRSDLILKLHIYESATGYVFDVDGVYVP